LLREFIIYYYVYECLQNIFVTIIFNENSESQYRFVTNRLLINTLPTVNCNAINLNAINLNAINLNAINLNAINLNAIN